MSALKCLHHMRGMAKNTLLCVTSSVRNDLEGCVKEVETSSRARVHTIVIAATNSDLCPYNRTFLHVRDIIGYI